MTLAGTRPPNVKTTSTEEPHREHLSASLGDVESADASGVAGTPTFFINGRRHYGRYDLDSLSAAVRATQQRNAGAVAPP